MLNLLATELKYTAAGYDMDIYDNVVDSELYIT